jgi:phosphoglycerate kinase
MKSINDVNFKGKKVLIRVDFNVPLDHNRQIADDTRIKESLPTIQKVLDDGAKVILLSHLGRPKGNFELDYSLSPVVPVLNEYLGRDVIFTHDPFGPKTFEYAENMKAGDVMLLENLRFYPDEEEGNEEFAEKLSTLGDTYIMDAFATAHRDHASTSKIAKYFPKDKYFGLLMEHEIKNLEKVLNTREVPFTAVIGGAKVSTKIDIIKNLISKVDNIIIGGGMAFTFIKSLGGNVGDSLYEADKIDLAKELVQEMMLKGVNLILPIDIVAADAFSNTAQVQHVDSHAIPKGWMGLDIGVKSRRRFAEIINSSKTILWNGPMGVFEMEQFKSGTKAVAIAVASATISGSYSAIGGGDSVAAINRYNLADMLTYVSTGGGAMLEYIEGRQLPGIESILSE